MLTANYPDGFDVSELDREFADVPTWDQLESTNPEAAAKIDLEWLDETDATEVIDMINAVCDERRGAADMAKRLRDQLQVFRDRRVQSIL